MNRTAAVIFAEMERELGQCLTPGGSYYPRLPRARMEAAIARGLELAAATREALDAPTSPTQ